MAIVIPSLGSVSLPTNRIGYGWRDGLVVGIIITPPALIIFGAVRSPAAEMIGWVLWFALVGLSIIQMFHI